MRISDWSSDVCSSDLLQVLTPGITAGLDQWQPRDGFLIFDHLKKLTLDLASEVFMGRKPGSEADALNKAFLATVRAARSEEHTSELQSLMRISYAVFCLKNKNIIHTAQSSTIHNPN